MASRSAATPSKESPSTIPVNKNKEEVQKRVKDRIAGRAYDKYQQSGNQGGQDMRHWLEAESEVITNVPEIRESASWFTVNVPLRGFLATEIQVTVEPDYAIVAAEKQKSLGEDSSRVNDIVQQSIYSTAKWPTNVDPGTASAYLKNGVLTLTVKRADAAGTDSQTNRSAGAGR